MRRYVQSALFWLFFVVLLVGLTPPVFVVGSLAAPFDRDRRVWHWCNSFWAMLHFYLNPFWRLRVLHRERIPVGGPAVLVSNHESLGDILALYGLWRQFKYVSKAAVFRVPFLGWHMRFARYVPLVRGERASVERMMTECRHWLSRGIPVLIFPEGTRSRDGTIQPFKDGAFRLAVEQDCPVVPIVLDGTGRTLPARGWLLARSADCRVSVLPAVDPAPFGGDVAALREDVRARMVAEKRALADGAPARLDAAVDAVGEPR